MLGEGDECWEVGCPFRDDEDADRVSDARPVGILKNRIAPPANAEADVEMRGRVGEYVASADGPAGNGAELAFPDALGAFFPSFLCRKAVL